MSTPMAAREIGEAWLEFVSETFVHDEGCNRPEVLEEYVRIESDETFARGRETWRSYTDTLIDRILQCTPEARTALFASTDARSLAYVQDRIHSGTELLTALVQKGLQINLEGADALPEFFRQILLQKLD